MKEKVREVLIKYASGELIIERAVSAMLELFPKPEKICPECYGKGVKITYGSLPYYCDNCQGTGRIPPKENK